MLDKMKNTKLIYGIDRNTKLIYGIDNYWNETHYRGPEILRMPIGPCGIPRSISTECLHKNICVNQHYICLE